MVNFQTNELGVQKVPDYNLKILSEYELSQETYIPGSDMSKTQFQPQFYNQLSDPNNFNSQNLDSSSMAFLIKVPYSYQGFKEKSHACKRTKKFQRLG